MLDPVSHVSFAQIFSTRKIFIKSNNIALQKRDEYSNLVTPSSIYAKAEVHNNRISFRGWEPSKQNRASINNAVKLIKSPDIKRIALIAHKNPDADAISSMTAMAELINLATGKKADMFIAKKLYDENDYLENADDFNIVDYKTATAEQVSEKYGKYDLAIALDTAELPLLENCLRDGIFLNARHTMKVDHHPIPARPTYDENRRYNYADMNVVDSSMSSNSQFLMQFVKPMGIKPDNLTQPIAKAFTTGLVSDTNALLFAKSNSAFEDMALLYNRVNYEEIVDRTKNMSLEDFSEERNWMNHVQLSPDGKKAYIIVDRAFDKPLKSIVKADILSKIINISGVEYVFSITGDSSLPPISDTPGVKPDSYDFRTIVSVRSKTANLNDIIKRYNLSVPDDKKLYGGGHDKARSIRTDMSIQDVEDTLLNIF